MEKKSGSTWAYTLALILLLLLSISWQLQKINSLQHQLTTTKHELSSQMSALGKSVDELQQSVDEADRVVEDYTIVPTGIDGAQKALLADVSVSLRSYQEDTTVLLLTDSALGRQEAAMDRTGEGVFTAPAALPLTGETPVEFTLAVNNGGTVTRKQIGGESTSALLPLQMGELGGSSSEWKNSGELTLGDFSMQLTDMYHQGTTANNVEFRLYHNTKLVATRPGTLDASDFFYYSGDWESIDVNKGDGVRLTVACTDDYGLRYEFTLKIWKVEDGLAESEDGIIDHYPTLTWPAP